MKKAFRRYNLQRQHEALKRAEAISADNQKTDDEKSAEIRDILNSLMEDLQKILDDEISPNDVVVDMVSEFWEKHYRELEEKGIKLRKIQKKDKDKFMELAIENAVNPKLFQVEEYREGLWKDHNRNTTIVFTIEKDGQYAGYCSVNDVTKNNWEISIELLRKFHRQGIGYTAMNMMLNEIKKNFSISEFRIRIMSDNIASRKLFEKLGAEPNGISEYMIHNPKEIIEFEEMYLDTITDDLREVAKRFNVEPRQLLSHVLEYKLVWK